jgi:glutamine synthetase
LTPEEKVQLGITQLPGSLLEALEELDKDVILKDALGPDLYEVFRRAKLAEWDEYRMQVMDWEIEKYLETS